MTLGFVRNCTYTRLASPAKWRSWLLGIVIMWYTSVAREIGNRCHFEFEFALRTKHKNTVDQYHHFFRRPYHIPSATIMSLPFQSIDQNVAEVQPLHQDKKPQSNLEHQRQLLAKKIAETDGKFASPTDSMMSPCTAKLQANKKRHYNKYDARFSRPIWLLIKPGRSLCPYRAVSLR